MRSSAQFGEWMSSLERKKKMSLFFFLFEVTKLQGSGGNCCSDFILWEAGGCLPEAAACRVICIACPLVLKGSSSFPRPSASLESGPLVSPRLCSPFHLSPPLPFPDLLHAASNKLPRQVLRTHPNHFESQLADKGGIISTLLVAGCWREVLWGTHRGPLASLPPSHLTSRC